jgi:hypothetical protein
MAVASIEGAGFYQTPAKIRKGISINSAAMLEGARQTANNPIRLLNSLLLFATYFFGAGDQFAGIHAQSASDSQQGVQPWDTRFPLNVADHLIGKTGAYCHGIHG